MLVDNKRRRYGLNRAMIIKSAIRLWCWVICRIAYTYPALSAQREFSVERQWGIRFRVGPASVTPGRPALLPWSKKDSPEQRVVGVSSPPAAETQRIAATLGWSDDSAEWWREGRWRLQHSRGAGFSHPDGCQSKKVNDSTKLAPPPPQHSCLPGYRKWRLVLERGALRGKGGMLGVWILPEVCGRGIFMIINTRAGTVGWAGDSLYPSKHPPLSHP